MTIAPDGKYLYTADLGSANVSAFAINQTNGGLSSLGTIDTGLSGSEAITATNNFVFVNAEDDQIATLKIGSDGKLSCSSSGCITTETGARFNAMAADRSGKFLFAASNGDYQLYGYSIGTDGALTPLTSSPGALTNGQWFGQVSFSIDNKSLYVADESNGVYAFSFNANNGAVAAVSGSPYPNSSSYAMTVAVDPSNGFVYSDDGETDIFGWKRDKTTGALTSIDTPDQPLATSAVGSVTAVTVTF